MWHAWERKEKCTRFWWESQKERDHSEDQGVGGKMGSEWILGETVAVYSGSHRKHINTLCKHSAVTESYSRWYILHTTATTSVVLLVFLTL
jgi:hypothetical protein